MIRRIYLRIASKRITDNVLIAVADCSPQAVLVPACAAVNELAVLNRKEIVAFTARVIELEFVLACISANMESRGRLTTFPDSTLR